jgi:hypothetical protein
VNATSQNSTSENGKSDYYPEREFVHGGDFITEILFALEVTGDWDVPGDKGARVAMGAVAPVPMKLSEAVMGRWSLTQPVKMAAAMANPIAAEVFISI